MAERTASEVFLADVDALLRQLRLGTHARPVSGHEVVQGEILPAIARLQAFLDYVMRQHVSRPHEWLELDKSITHVCGKCGGHGDRGANIHLPHCVWSRYQELLHPDGDPERPAPYAISLTAAPSSGSVPHG